jgi:hypothetical protein
MHSPPRVQIALPIPDATARYHYTSEPLDGDTIARPEITA